jgi:hypothetical protein
MPELWLVLDKQDVPLEDYLDMRVSLNCSDELDEMAKSLSLRPLSAHVGMEEDDWEAMREEMIDAGIEDAEPWTPEQRPFFPAAEGVDWSRKIRAHLQTLDDPFPDAPDTKEDIIEELKGLERILEQADRAGAKWGLMYGT